MPTKTAGRPWRAFTLRERQTIEARLHAPDGSCCPRCGDILEARPLTRSSLASDLECRECRRYFSRNVRTTPETIYLVGIQKLATAILRI